jgi:hypothetical protein
MNCANCGHEIYENNRFCENCGTPVTQSPNPAMEPASQAGIKPKVSRLVWIAAVVLITFCAAAIAGLLIVRSRGYDLKSLLSKPTQDSGYSEESSGFVPLMVKTQVPTHGIANEEIISPASSIVLTAAGFESQLPKVTEAAEPDVMSSADTFLAMTDNGIWVIDELTKKSIQISKDQLDDTWNLQKGLSPNGQFYAYVTGFNRTPINPLLRILDLKNQNTLLRLELTGSIVKSGVEIEFDDPSFNAYHAMQLPDSFAWSPDSQNLAFIAARDGASADVYLCNLNTRSVTRLSYEESHANSLHWSPNGEYLQYLSTFSFGAGGGSEMDALWTFDFQQNTAKTLENLGSNGEHFVAWAENDQILIASINSACGLYQLRFVNLTDASREVLVDGCFASIAYSTEDRIGIFSVTDFEFENCSCGEKLEPGLWLIEENIGQPVAGDFGVMRFDDSIAYAIEYIPQDSFFTIYGDNGIHSIYSDDAIYSFDFFPEIKDLSPFPSPNSEYWAWASQIFSGLWVLDSDGNLFEISSDFTGIPLWSRDGERLYFYENDRILSAIAPDYETVTVFAELRGETLIGLVK